MTLIKGKTRPGTTKKTGPSLPATDNAETLPMGDIMGESVPTESFLPSSSPDVETSKIRASYQRRDVQPRSPDDDAVLTSGDPVPLPYCIISIEIC